MMVGTVRLWASKDMACGGKKEKVHAKMPSQNRTDKQKCLFVPGLNAQLIRNVGSNVDSAQKTGSQ